MRKLFCWLGMCPHRPASDDTGCWGECDRCGHRAGFVDRATLSAYTDREIAREQARRAAAGAGGMSGRLASKANHPDTVLYSACDSERCGGGDGLGPRKLSASPPSGRF